MHLSTTMFIADLNLFGYTMREFMSDGGTCLVAVVVGVVANVIGYQIMRRAEGEASFWTIKGFLRNALYNGWNSIFPWIAYFFLGMWLGRINWQDTKIRKRIFIIGFIFFCLTIGLQKYSIHIQSNIKIAEIPIVAYINSVYLPNFLPFMIITASFALMVITICIWLGETFKNVKIVVWLSDTGKMTLTNYVQHLTIGVLIFQFMTGSIFPRGHLQTGKVIPPEYILMFSLCYFIVSVLFSVLWTRKFKKGPLELLMRKISG